MTEYTRGKWETSVLSNGKEWQVCEEGGGDMICDLTGTERAEANARLISASPELLEACKEAQRLVRMARRYFPKSIRHNDTFELNNVSTNIIQQAIDKAEGNSLEEYIDSKFTTEGR